MSDWMAVFCWIASMVLVLGVMGGIALIWDAIDRMNEYDKMKKRGFIPLKDDNGDDWWVGYGD